MFEQARKEIHSNRARVELNTAEVALTVLQALIGRVDREEAALRDAIGLCTAMRQEPLAKRLKAMIGPIVIPYEKICGHFEKIQL